MEGGIEVTGRLGRRRRKLLDCHKDKKGFWELKEEALDRTFWSTRFGGVCGPVFRTDCSVNEKAQSTFAAYICENFYKKFSFLHTML
jgi:hypothetical protein